jgi:hypothetical protein
MATFDARLATRVTRDVRRRLKLAAVVAGTSISATLTEVLDEALPTQAELADLLQKTGTGVDEPR